MRATGSNRVVAFSSVIGPVSRDAANGLVWRDLLEQFWQHGRVADIAGGDLDRPHFQCFFVDPYVYLAPYPAFRAAMLAGVPLAFTFRLDAGTVDEQAQRAGAATKGQVHVQCLLTAAQGAEIRHRPVQPDQPQQALDKTRGLPERHAEKHLQG